MNSEYLRVFKAFSDEKRLKVLQLLTQGEKCACILLEELDISQPTLSYHMKILCSSGIVRERPVGPWKYYSIDPEGCAYAQRLLQSLSFGGESVEIRIIKLLWRICSMTVGKTASSDISVLSECRCSHCNA
ncbi:MAG: winged helix-turn-helix transcriptional regulator [Oscillospiraceae bacterium]|nr:winged helix-turn-helix transcriptional regulator [Oscillospiraceae bacterium]